MSRVGKEPIEVPAGVSVVVDGSTVNVTGSMGSLSQALLPGIKLTQADNIITISRDSDEAVYRSNHGLMRSLVNNMVEGVSRGFSKKLEINGVGYRVAMDGANLRFSLGFSHDVNFSVPEGITANIEQNTVTIKGISKQQVGQIAAEIRSLKKPEPYKGKGIKYVGEHIIRKSGKSGKDKAA
ncbi:MAG TPA: 50S ribosomal protein L6 [Candidatus Saccharimonadales bacterium]|nr:50S ribosomal protein L6 [Candidatus Saccharimonadales bacterium]